MKLYIDHKSIDGCINYNYYSETKLTKLNNDICFLDVMAQNCY